MVGMTSMPTPSPQQGRLGLAALLLATLIWGTTFPAIKELSDRLVALEIMLGRYSLALLVLLPLLWGVRRAEWRLGGLLGLLLFAGAWLQMEGLMRTSSNRNAFLTGLNVLMVPMIGLLLGQRVLWTLWASCALAAIGMAALFWQDSPWNLGDTLTLAGALMFALYVIVLERGMHGRVGADACRPLRLTAVQMLVMVTGALCLLGGQGVWRGEGLAPIWSWLPRADLAAWLSLLYLALMASILGLTLQVWGQRHVSAVSAAIVYGNEPVFAALAAWVLIHERLSSMGWLGAALIVSALILSQLPERVFRPRAQTAT